MKFFKTKPSAISQRYAISPAEFDEVTERKFPFEQKNTDKRISLYGICPSCLNPIQLVGMSSESKMSPYGKHTGKNVNGLPRWNQKKYEYCPHAAEKSRKQIDENELLPEITDNVIELYNLLRDNFDRVVYVVQKSLDIRCSPKFWKEALKQYLANNAYLYPWLTESNLPYIFALRGMTHNRVFGQRVRIGTELYEKLNKHKYVNMLDVDNQNDDYRIISNKGGFLNIEFRFAGHQQKAGDGETLVESVRFCIDDLMTGKMVYDKRIEFDETYFMNIVNCQKSNYRNKTLLDIANKLMPPLS